MDHLGCGAVAKVVLALAAVLVLAPTPVAAHVAQVDWSNCPPLPLTGCLQSSQVGFFNSGGKWTWTPSEGLSSSEDLPAPPLNDDDLSFCVWDGTSLSGDFRAFPTGTATLLYPSRTGDKSQVKVKSGSLQAEPLRPFWASTLPAGIKQKAVAQVVSGDGRCWGKVISIDYSSPAVIPPLPTVFPPLNLSAGLQLLDAEAAAYNCRSKGKPLSIAGLLAGIAPTQILSKKLGGAPAASAAEVTGPYSALFLAGFYGGVWFADDGFGGILRRPSSQNLTTTAQPFQGALSVPFLPTPNVLGFLSSQLAINNGGNQQIFGGLVGTYGYNYGYTVALLGIGQNKGYVPTGGVGLSGCVDTDLFACTVTPPTLPQLQNLRATVSSYASVVGQGTVTSQVAVQTVNYGTGFNVWATGGFGGIPPGGLSIFIRNLPAAWQIIYEVNNYFLEALQLAGWAVLRALTTNSGGDATVAATLQLSTFAWLSAYQYGLNQPVATGGALPLPTFNLGITPI